MISATSETGMVTVSATDDRHDRDIEVDLAQLCHLAVEVLGAEGVSAGGLDLHLIDSEQMAELNQEHMGHEGPTDVLSFPLDGLDDDADLRLPPQAQMLGDVVVCPTVAAAQAASHVGDVRGELQLLVIHGLLHVLGHDHAEPDETKRMQDRERVHLSSIGVSHPEPA